MRTSLVAEKASGQRLRQRSAQLRGFRWWKHRAWGAVAQAEHHPMAKSNPVDETRIADPVERTKRQPLECQEGGQNSEGAETATRRKMP